MRRWPMANHVAVDPLNDQSKADRRKKSPELARLQSAYEKVKDFPDARKGGWPDMLELRQAVERYLLIYGP